MQHLPDICTKLPLNHLYQEIIQIYIKIHEIFAFYSKIYPQGQIF